MILPKQHAITNLIVDYDYEHKKNLHGDVQMVHAAIRQRYWIMLGKIVVEKYSKRCVKCRRQRALKLQQMMGALPGDRVNVARSISKNWSRLYWACTAESWKGSQ